MNLIDRNREYKLPASLYVALASERGELVAVTIREVEDRLFEPTPELVRELLVLVANLISERRDLMIRQEQNEENAADMIGEISDARHALKRVERLLKSFEETATQIARTEVEEDE
jgi:hypothetical protein